jgi:ABC-2 type transport system ATP-binding protein
VEYVAVLKEWNDRHKRIREVRRVLDLVGLSDLAAKKVAKLSGGQKRRVGLAQALLGEPRILVLDEPTTGLDAASEAQVMTGLNRLIEGRTTILITHSTALACAADGVAYLTDGKVVEQGSPEKLLESDSAFRRLLRTQELLGRRPGTDNRPELVLVPGHADREAGNQ